MLPAAQSLRAPPAIGARTGRERRNGAWHWGLSQPSPGRNPWWRQLDRPPHARSPGSMIIDSAWRRWSPPLAGRLGGVLLLGLAVFLGSCSSRQPNDLGSTATPTLSVNLVPLDTSNFLVPLQMGAPAHIRLFQWRNFNLIATWYDAKDRSRGITVAYIVTTPSFEPCRPEADPATFRTDPEGFLADVAFIAELPLHVTGSTNVNGRTAVTADVAGGGSPCGGSTLGVNPSFPGRISNPWLLLDPPSRLLAIEHGRFTVLVHLWASSENELAEWADEMEPTIQSITLPSPN